MGSGGGALQLTRRRAGACLREGRMIEQKFSADYPRNYRIRREGAAAALRLTSQSPRTRAHTQMRAHAACSSGPGPYRPCQTHRRHRPAALRAASFCGGAAVTFRLRFLYSPFYVNTQDFVSVVPSAHSSEHSTLNHHSCHLNTQSLHGCLV